MRTSNLAKGRLVASSLRLLLVTVVAFTLVMGGIALNPQPAQAIFDINPPLWNSPPLQECVPFVGPTFTATCCTCSNPPQNVFFWLEDTGTGIPSWVNIDPNTGVLSGCPPKDASIDPLNPFTFGVRCTELCVCPPSCTIGDCWPWGAATFPCVTISPTVAVVTLNIVAYAPPCVTDINPTFYPVAWESMPFTMTLSATGGVGPLNWVATGLPAGLTVTDSVNGIISGIPAPGTCGIYTVTANVTDTGVCLNCCPTISRPFILFVDCWANYPPIFYYTSACDFTVEIGLGLMQGQTSVLVDGTQEAILGGGQSEAFTSIPCESHLVMVDQTIPGTDPQTRYAVVGSNIKMVTDVDNYAFFDYVQEVFIDTASDPIGVSQKPPGAGFYAIGSNFSSTAPSPVESHTQNGIRYVFRAWSLPDGNTSPSRSVSFTVNSAGTARASYDTYCLLQLKSDDPFVNETSWELKGSTATYDLALKAVPLQGFWGSLGGALKPINASGSHVMTEPYIINILWRTDLTMPIAILAVIGLLIVGLAVFLVIRRKRASLSTVPAATAQSPQPPTAATEVTPTKPAVAAQDEKKTSTEAESAERPNFCPKCGAPVEKDAVFCRKCGKRLIESG